MNKNAVFEIRKVTLLDHQQFKREILFPYFRRAERIILSLLPELQDLRKYQESGKEQWQV